MSTKHSPSHVSTARHDLVVIEEAAATQVSSMAGKLATHSNVALASFEAEREETLVGIKSENGNILGDVCRHKTFPHISCGKW